MDPYWSTNPWRPLLSTLLGATPRRVFFSQLLVNRVRSRHCEMVPRGTRGHQKEAKESEFTETKEVVPSG